MKILITNGDEMLERERLTARYYGIMSWSSPQNLHNQIQHKQNGKEKNKQK